MKCLFLFSILLASALAVPQGYGAPPPPSNGGYGGGPSCGQGQVADANGKCTRPEVSRSVYVYNAPEQEQTYQPAPYVPKPKIEIDIVFVKTPEGQEGPEPIVVPPPQKKTLVYVLSKKQEQEGQQVIELPTGPKHKPEVYYVNYDEGANPSLPGGISLQDALNAASQTGQEIDGASNGGGGGGGYGPPPPSPTYG